MRKLLVYITLAACAVLAVNCSSTKMKIKTKSYPVTAKQDVTDNYHGTVVADPYRWLEDDNSAATADWVARQNEVTFDYLSQIPFRGQIRERLTELWNYEKIGIPFKAGDKYYYMRNDGLQNQSVLYQIDSLRDPNPVVFLDPNKLAADGTMALVSVNFSREGKYMAYSVSKAGSDWVEIVVKDVKSGNMLSDTIRWVKFSGANWAKNEKGFYYSAYDKPEQGSELSGVNQFQKVYYHELGTPQSADKLIYTDMENPLRYFHGSDDRDKGRWIFIDASEGTHGTEILYKKVNSKENFKVLFPGFRYDYGIMKCKGDTAYVYTNDNAPNYRLARINLANPSEGLVDVIPQNDNHLLETVSFAGGYMMARYLEDAVSKIYQYTMDGELVREVTLPGLGTVSGFSGKDKDSTVFYSLTNFTAPATIYRYSLKTGKSTLYTQPSLKYDPDQLVSEQVFFTSKDGTRVPMFLVHRKDMKLDGNNPVYLYGYGGFNISLTPSFSPTNIAMIEQGAIYAMVNLRGGGEYGEKWHEGGMLANKQNVFDDFISAAEHLVKNKYTNSGKIAIAGGSNGGLLVGACMTQRPDLFAVAFPAVGVLDMLRYHKFTVGWGWAVEYGSSDNAEQFEYIYKYSPLHNIRKGVCYPATLITTADHDDRVVPAHSFKFAATLQEAQKCSKPTLIRIDTNAGHGAGKPTAKRIDEAADVMSFFFWNTDTAYGNE